MRFAGAQRLRASANPHPCQPPPQLQGLGAVSAMTRQSQHWGQASALALSTSNRSCTWGAKSAWTNEDWSGIARPIQPVRPPAQLVKNSAQGSGQCDTIM